MEGIAGHKIVALRRPAHYQSEVLLAGDFEGTLRVRGRADGYDPKTHTLEEIKTFRGDLAKKPENQRSLHWAQLKIYGWLLCQQQSEQQSENQNHPPGIETVNLALVYLDLGNLEETVFVETHSAASLKVFFDQQCALFLHWAEQEIAHRTARDAALEFSREFPLGAFRPGQRELAGAVYRSARDGHCLLAQAPTGIGKTMATVYGVLKAMPAQKIDKLFFLTAKTSGRQLALDALQHAALKTRAPLRILELVARSKACEFPDNACHGDSCPLARGFYNRLPAARLQAVATPGLMDRALLRHTALENGICPYYLAQELVRWSDAIVGDYNYYFDYSALLFSQMQRQEWRVSLLADEAHNLVERARSMYSAALDQATIQAVFAQTPKSLRVVLMRLDDALNAVHCVPEMFLSLDEPPQIICVVLKQVLTAFGEYAESSPGGLPEPVQQLFFDLLHFARMADSFGEHSVMNSTRLESSSANTPFKLLQGASTVRLGIHNAIPAYFLAERFNKVHSAALFSATLLPQHYFLKLLGMPKSTHWLDVDSPFSAAQLRVAVVHDLTNIYSQRAKALPPMVAIMARVYANKPGNYLVFSSSYELLESLLGHFKKAHPHIACWHQSQNMEEAAQTKFIDQFKPEGKGMGFAVLGGSFGEGIDLTGSRLVGVFIANLGLAPPTLLNQQIKQSLASQLSNDFGESTAYDYAYTYPAMQRVVQAAGRVIRTLTDTGSVILMDQRFTRPALLQLMPAWWSIEMISKNSKEH